jgi:predicted transcriptional regulator of viral defense system
MSKKSKALFSFFRKQGGVLRFSEVTGCGFHPDSLKALEKAEKVENIGLGIYRLNNYPAGPYPDLVAVSLQAPGGVICLVSALAFHGSTDEIPGRVDIAIPEHAYANRIKYPPVRFYRFARPSWEAGIEEHIINRRKVKIYSLEKTVADCFKFRNRIGMDTARGALKTAVSEKHAAPGAIMAYAKINRVDGIVKPILEALM